MFLDVDDTLSVTLPEHRPPWTVLFLKAVEKLEEVEEREDDRKEYAVLQQRLRDGSLGATSSMDGWEKDEFDMVAEAEGDRSLLIQAESYLLNVSAANACRKPRSFLLYQAMVHANRREPLLLTWLIDTYTRREDFSRARAAALELVRLDPLCASSIFGLVACYEKERDFASAYEWMKEAVSLTVLSERSLHNDKLRRLAQQVACMKDNAFRKDPFDILPLEVIVNIMNFGIQSDRDLLRCSWVNQKWRKTINNCKELYGIFTLRGSVGKSKSFDEKRKAWTQRSGGQFHTLKIEEITLSGITKLSRTYDPPFQSSKSVQISVKDNKILRRLVDKASKRCQNLTHVDISTQDMMPWEPEPFSSVPLTIHCDFAATSTISTLQSITVRNVDYRASRGTARQMFEQKTVAHAKVASILSGVDKPDR